MSTLLPVVWLADIDLESESVGKHTKHLAKLTKSKLPIVPGFVITAKAYKDFLQENNLELKIKQILSTIAADRPDSLMQGETHIKELFKRTKLNEKLEDEIIDFYFQLGDEVSITLFETGSHGKKHKTLHASTEDELIDQIVKLWSEMFSSSAIWHRHHQKHDHLQADAEILIQGKADAQLTGTVITIDPVHHEKNKIVIMTNYPHKGDTYVLSKKTLTILDRTLHHTAELHKLTLDEILEIGTIAKRVEEQVFFPQEIKWAMNEGIVYITGIKPFTSLPQPKQENRAKLPIARGKGITARIGTGVVRIINSSLDLHNANSHDIVVIDYLEAKLVPSLKKVRGVLIEANQWHSETAALLRHFGIPAVANLKQAKKLLKNGHIITIHGAKGEIYRGGFH